MVLRDASASKKSSPAPLWGHRLPVTALALSARGLDKESFLFVCHLCWFGECGRHSMSIVVQGVGSHLRFYCCSETFHLHKPITSSIDNCEDERCQHPDIDSPQNLDSRVCSQRLLFSGDHTWTTAATCKKYLRASSIVRLKEIAPGVSKPPAAKIIMVSHKS